MLYTGRVEISDGMLNVRMEPDGVVIGQLEKGEEVRVMADLGAWLEISFALGAGYVAKQYICFVKAEQQEPGILIEDDGGNAFMPIGGFTVKTVMGEID